ncbi:hypothetical protein [uncultured Abyssibacter sp.]|uniref:hypothetical protein n=1 Tax=uncultured Abyssibacter sp. TaxID=2320202 RepID=UPI0032B122AF
MKHSRLAYSLAAVSTLAAAGCAIPHSYKGTDAEIVETAPAKPVMDVSDYYEAHHEGRIYVFDDFATYKAFLDYGHTAYRLVRIGEGPDGETIVFGLTDDDKAKREGIASVALYDGEVSGAENFYGEVLYDGRFYVFDRWEDLQAFKGSWDAPYRFTEIGAGPGSRTIVYVLHDGNKEVRPDALIGRFKKRHGLPIRAY